MLIKNEAVERFLFSESVTHKFYRRFYLKFHEVNGLFH